jgi:hypothetical protein
MAEELLEAGEEMSDEDIALLKELGILPEKLGALDQQIAEAMFLRDRPWQAQGRDTGRVYVAANPMEHIGEFMQKARSKTELKKLRDLQEAGLKTMGEARGTVLDRWLRGRGKGAATPPIAPPMNPIPNGGLAMPGRIPQP